MPPRGYKKVTPEAPKPKKPRTRGAQGIEFVFDQEKIAQVEAMMGAGLSKPMICSILGIDRSTLASHAAKNAQLNEAMERGLATASLHVGLALVKKARQGDVPAIKWWEQTRLGYHEKQSMAHTGPSGGPVEVVSTHLSLSRNEGESERDYLARLKAGTDALLAKRASDMAPGAEA